MAVDETCAVCLHPESDHNPSGYRECYAPLVDTGLCQCQGFRTTFREPDWTARFLSPLRTEKLGAQRWILTDDLVFESKVLRGRFIAPRGFQTDLASIPRALWAICPKVDVYDAAAVIHDAAYGNALTTFSGYRVFLIKTLADDLFYEACRVEGVSAFRARLMHWAVSTFGDPLGHPLAENR